MIRLSDDKISGKYNVLKDRNLEIAGMMSDVRAVFERYETARFSMVWKAGLAEAVDFTGARDMHIDVSMFPILNSQGELEGVLTLDKIRTIMFNKSLYDNTYVEQLMLPVPVFIDKKDHMETVMEKFNASNAWNLPVLDNGKYSGFLSKSVVLSEYRKKMVEFSDE